MFNSGNCSVPLVASIDGNGNNSGGWGNDGWGWIWIILIFAITYFLLSCTFSYLWTKKYKNGPFEMLMRRISG